MEKKDMISKESFEKYEAVRESGVTNMFDVKTVGELSGLQREIILDIMDNYDYLSDKYDNHIETEGLRKAGVL